MAMLNNQMVIVTWNCHEKTIDLEHDSATFWWFHVSFAECQWDYFNGAFLSLAARID